MTEDDSVELAALLQRWQKDPRQRIEDTEMPHRRHATFQVINRGSVAQREQALLALRTCGSSSSSFEDRRNFAFDYHCPSNESAALVETLCSTFSPETPPELISVSIETLAKFLNVIQSEPIPAECRCLGDPERFRDDVLLKLVALVTIPSDAEMLVDVWNSFVQRDLVKNVPVFRTASCVEGLFKLAPVLNNVHGVSKIMQTFLIVLALPTNGALPPDEQRALLWRPGLREFFVHLASVLLTNETPYDFLTPYQEQSKMSVTDHVVFAVQAMSLSANPASAVGGSPCPLLDDEDFYHAVVFPLLHQTQHPTSECESMMLKNVTSMIPMWTPQYFISEAFRDIVIIPHTSRSMSEPRAKDIVSLLQCLVKHGDEEKVRQTFATPKFLARCFSVLIKRAQDLQRDVVSASKRRKKLSMSDQISLEGKRSSAMQTAIEATSLLATLLGTFDSPAASIWPAGIDSAIWGSSVLFDDIFVPLVSVVPFQPTASDCFLRMLHAFWVRRPARVTPSQLRDRVILPLVKASVDVLPLMADLLERSGDDTPANRAFKDAFSTTQALEMYSSSSRYKPIIETNAFFLPAKCALSAVKDGEQLNSARADAITTKALGTIMHNIYAAASTEGMKLLRCLAEKSPAETDEAVALRQSYFLDSSMCFVYPSMVPGSHLQKHFFRALRVRMSRQPCFLDSLAEADTGGLRCGELFVGGCLNVAKGISTAAEAADCLEALPVLFDTVGWQVSTPFHAEYLTALAPCCTTVRSVAALVRFADGEPSPVF